MNDKEIQKATDNKQIKPFGEGHMLWVPPGYEVVTEAPAPAETQTHLWDYIWLLWNRRWMVALVFLLCAGAATLKMLRATPIYEAGAKLQIERDAPKIVAFEGNDTALSSNNGAGFVETQIQILQSRTLARQVVEQLNLFAGRKAAVAEGPDVLDAFGVKDYVKSFVEGVADPIPTEGSAEDRQMQYRIAAFLASLGIARIKDTGIVYVSYRSPDPQQCADVANALCDAYIRWNYQTKSESYAYAQKWVDQNLYEAKAKLEKSEEDLYKYAGSEQVLVLADNMEGLTKNYEATRQELAIAERALREREFELKALEENKTPEPLIEETRLKGLREQLAAVNMKYDQALLTFGTEMNEVKVLKTERDHLAALITEEEKNVATLRQQQRDRALAEARLAYERAVSSRDSLKQHADAQQKQLVDLQQRLVQYNILKREVEVNRSIYNSLLESSRQVGVTSSLKAGNVAVVERAERPLAPKLPNKPRGIALGAFLGLFLGVGLVFFLEYMDQSVKTTEEVQRLTQLAPLGMVPHVGPAKRGAGAVAPERLTEAQPTSIMAESIRSLRTALQYSRPGRAPQTLLVTSSLPGEGKTTVATNLAIAYAQRGLKSILIDADLQKPGIHKIFPESSCEVGLTEILTGTKTTHVNVKTSIPNLSVLTSGSRPPNPADLLDSRVMRDLLALLSEKFDRIIIDSAPVLHLAAPTVLMPLVDGVVLVAQPGKTPRGALRRLSDKLRTLGLHEKVLGVVMNNARGRFAGEGRGYGYGYEYGYGYGYGAKGGNGLALPGNGNGKGNGRHNGNGNGKVTANVNSTSPSR